MSLDGELIRIVDAAMAEAARRSGDWLVCQLGCTQCCIGPFPISQLDGARLREGLAELELLDPARATRLRHRVKESVAKLLPDFPGDAASGMLDEGEAAEERFDALANDEPCPVLDPETGACDLYSARPIPCRAFGPPLSCGSGAVGVCELCYEGATEEQIAACQVEVDPGNLEGALIAELEAAGARGRTIVAFALEPGRFPCLPPAPPLPGEVAG